MASRRAGKTRRGFCSWAALTSACLCVTAKQFEERRGRVRERRIAAAGGPERAAVGEAADGGGRERAAFEFFGDAHSGDEGDADLLLNESLDRLDGRKLKRDVERRAVLGE